MKPSFLFFGLFLLVAGILSAQRFPEVGIPLLSNFHPEQYEQAGKVWAIAAAANGLVYCASDQGLLEYDGRSWQLFQGSTGITRSVLVVNDSTIYTGSDKDFGVWRRNALLQFEYQSLYPFRESTKGLSEEFWGVYQLETEIVFVSFYNIYVLKAGRFTKIAAPFRFAKSFLHDQKLYLADEEYGLYHFDGLSLNALWTKTEDQSLQLMGVAESDRGLLLVTRKQGLYRLEKGALRKLAAEVNADLQQEQVFSFATIDTNYLAFGTILGGCYITDAEGTIIQHLDKSKGLPNNTILDIHYSPPGTLWLSMDYGLSALSLSDNVAYVLDYAGTFGSGQTALRRGEQFYLGTNQGLYLTKWQNLQNDVDGVELALVTGSAGQVWTLREIAGEVWCGHDRGLFQVRGGQLYPIHREAGVLAIEPLGGDHLLTGTYNGISLFRRSAAGWTFVRKLKPIQGACSQLIVVDEHELWINIPKFGIIRARLDDALTIAKQDIFPVKNFLGQYPQLYRDTAGIQVHTTEQSYRYEATSDTFKVFMDRLAASPQIARRLPQAHRALALEGGFGFFPVHNGFALRRPTPEPLPVGHPPVVIRSLTAFNNDTTLRVADGALIPFKRNNIRVKYLVPQQAQALYRYRLEGQSENWSAWSHDAQVSFLQLREGSYRLVVEAKIGEQLLPPTKARWQIKPPWYRHGYAYLGGLLLLLGLFYAQNWYQKRQLARQKNALQERKNTALRLQAEKFQQTKLVQRQQSMEAEITSLHKQLRSKTIELAKKAKESENKNRLLRALKDKLESIEVRSSSSQLRWLEMKRLLEGKLTTEDHTFEMQMDELHQDFLRQLKERYPELTTYDLRLSTYLKTGLSSREIAEIMNVLPSSVNVSRSRLRKKLKLKPEDDLYDFLNQLEQEDH